AAFPCGVDVGDGGKILPVDVTLEVEGISSAARCTRIHHHHCVSGNVATDNHGDRGVRFDHGVETVLPVAEDAVGRELDRLPGHEPPTCRHVAGVLDDLGGLLAAVLRVEREVVGRHVGGDVLDGEGRVCGRVVHD